jgi:Gas vesicle synthesis protein GvpL/GvpF
VIWIYAIGDRAEIPPPLSVAGLAGAPLEGVGEGRLLAVISRHAELPDIGGVDALWAHEHVVERLMAERTVLPVRFASRLTGEAVLRHELATRQDDLLAALDGVRGRVELAVRAMSATGPPRREVWRPTIAGAAENRHSGREYVRSKLELRDRAEAAGAALHVPLAALAVAGTRRPGRVPCEVLRASYLVERTAVAEFRALAQQLQREYRDMAVLCTGPWPPYSFVEVAVSSRREGGGG